MDFKLWFFYNTRLLDTLTRLVGRVAMETRFLLSTLCSTVHRNKNNNLDISHQYNNKCTFLIIFSIADIFIYIFYEHLYNLIPAPFVDVHPHNARRSTIVSKWIVPHMLPVYEAVKIKSRNIYISDIVWKIQP